MDFADTRHYHRLAADQVDEFEIFFTKYVDSMNKTGATKKIKNKNL